MPEHTQNQSFPISTNRAVYQDSYDGHPCSHPLLIEEAGQNKLLPLPTLPRLDIGCFSASQPGLNQAHIAAHRAFNLTPTTSHNAIQHDLNSTQLRVCLNPVGGPSAAAKWHTHRSWPPQATTCPHTVDGEYTHHCMTTRVRT